MESAVKSPEATNPIGRAARLAAVVLSPLFLLLSACSSSTNEPFPTPVAYHGPVLSKPEKHDHDRCVAALRGLWGPGEVKTSTVERGRRGLDYVWVNVEVHDDDDDLDKRIAHGATQGGHCQFEHPGQAMHVHAYPLVGEPSYHFFSADVDTVVAAAPQAEAGAHAAQGPEAETPADPAQAQSSASAAPVQP